MSTPAQIAANRNNAKKSTGPKTPEGKARSSRNAIIHGFYSKSFVFRNEEEKAEFETVFTNLYDLLDPHHALAHDFFNQILHSIWNLNRLREIESKIMTDHDNPFADPEAARQLDQIARHRARFERTYRGALKELRFEHKNQAIVSLLPDGVSEACPAVADVEKVQATLLRRAHLSQFYPSVPSRPRPQPNPTVAKVRPGKPADSTLDRLDLFR